MKTIEGNLRKVRRLLEMAHDNSPAFVPMHRLPPEILVSIFTYTIGSGSKRSNWPIGVPGFEGSSLPNSSIPTLMQVCRRWYQTLTSASQFWTHIQLCTGTFRAKYLKTMAQTWIQRSKQAPLHIEIGQATKPSRKPDGRLETLKAAFSLVEPEFSRCHSLVFKSSSSKVFEDIVASIAGAENLPLLTRLTINLDEEETEIPVTDGLSIAFSQVRHLSLRYIFGSWPSFGFKNLVTLKFVHGGASQAEFAEIIKTSPSLRTLYLDDFEIAGEPGTTALADRPTFPLFHLLELSLHRLDVDSLCSVLASCSAPNLKFLSIFQHPNFGSTSTVASQALKLMIERSPGVSSSLVELRLGHFIGPPTLASLAFSSFPLLRFVCIFDCRLPSTAYDHVMNDLNELKFLCWQHTAAGCVWSPHHVDTCMLS